MSALPQPQEGIVSVQQYLAHQAGATVRSEFIEGHVVAMAGASPAHNQIVVNLTTALSVFLREKACTNYANDLRVAVQSGTAYLYPDIVVACGEEQYLAGDPPSLLNPIVIIEVLSSATEARDRGDKFLQYQTISTLREYILVSQHTKRFESFRKEEGGVWAYRAFPRYPTLLEVPTLQFTLSTDEVYRRVPIQGA